MIKYVVFESFDFESFDKIIWHLSEGDIISYEFYTDTFDLHYSGPLAFEENNAIRIYVYDEHNNSTYFSGPAIDIKKYVHEIPQTKSRDYYPKEETPLSKMNHEIQQFIEEQQKYTDVFNRGIEVGKSMKEEEPYIVQFKVCDCIANANRFSSTIPGKNFIDIKQIKDNCWLVVYKGV